MFRIESENKVYEVIRSIFKIEPITHSHRSEGYQCVINYLRQWGSITDKMIVAYEVKLNKLHDKFPDFFLIKNGKPLRLEIKDKECEQRIAKEINSLGRVDSEFWYVICGNTSIRKIKDYLVVKNSKIKFVKFENLKAALIEYFN